MKGPWWVVDLSATPVEYVEGPFDFVWEAQEACQAWRLTSGRVYPPEGHEHTGLDGMYRVTHIHFVSNAPPGAPR